MGEFLFNWTFFQAATVLMRISMKDIWGGDCLEFKPERWINEQGGINNIPSHKFIAFNAGPRSCLGQDLSFFQMKTIVTAIIWNYRL